MIDAHLRAHPAHTLGHIFTHPSSVQRLKVQLDQVMRAFGKRERSAPLVAKRDRLAPPPAKRRLCGDCLILFDFFRPGEATSGRKGDFLLFVELVHEVATGVTPSRETSMNTPIRDTLKKYRTLLAQGKAREELWRSL